MADVTRKRRIAGKKKAADPAKRAARKTARASEKKREPFKYQAAYETNGIMINHTVDLSIQGKRYPKLTEQIVSWLADARPTITTEGARTEKQSINKILDYLDSWCERQGVSVKCPDVISDFTNEIGVDFLLWYRTEEGNDNTKAIKYRAMCRVLMGTAKHHGHELLMPPNAWRQKQNADDTYTDDDVKKWLNAAREEIRIYKALMKKANDLATEGAKADSFDEWSQSRVAHYFRDIIGNNIFSRSEFRAEGHRNLEEQTTKFPLSLDFPGVDGWYSGFFVPRDPIVAAFIIVACRTGWNAQTIMDININDWTRPYALSDRGKNQLHLVYSRKKRSNDKIQETISTSAEFHVYAIIKWVIEVTNPLRAMLDKKIKDLDEQSSASGLTQKQNKLRQELANKRNNLWLHVQRSGVKNNIPILALNNNIISKGSSFIIKKRNPDDDEHAFSAAMSRDAWILWAYNSSGFNLLVAQMAAGHTNLKTIVSYIHKQRTSAQNRQKIWDFQDHLFSEIEIGRIDPQVLRGRMENGAITAEQAKVLAEKSFTKTIHGAYCVDPYNPDYDVDPEHKDGEVCSTQACHRCRNAFWFIDSIEDIATQVDALRERKEQMEIDSWFTSQLPEQLEFYEKLLSSFDEKLRAERLADADKKPLPIVTFKASKRFYGGVDGR